MLDIIVIVCCLILLLLLLANQKYKADLTIIFYPLLLLMTEYNYKHFNKELDYSYMFHSLQVFILVVFIYVAVGYYLKWKGEK